MLGVRRKTENDRGSYRRRDGYVPDGDFGSSLQLRCGRICALVSVCLPCGNDVYARKAEICYGLCISHALVCNLSGIHNRNGNAYTCFSHRQNGFLAGKRKAIDIPHIEIPCLRYYFHGGVLHYPRTALKDHTHISLGLSGA